MTNLWTWLKDETNRKVVGWLVAGAGAIALYFGIFKPDPNPPMPSAQMATSAGGNAINASGSAAVSVGYPTVAASTATLAAASSPTLPQIGQSAQSNAGNAVNASGNAQVNIKP